MNAAKVNMVEGELDSFIARADQKRRREEGERPAVLAPTTDSRGV